MRIIDTHCHPQFSQYDADRDEVIRRALGADVGMICVGTDLETSRQAVALAERYDGVWASVGIHPNDVAGGGGEIVTFGNVSDIMKLSDHPKVVAIGEVGLDYYRTKDSTAQERQRSVLGDFLQTKKPLIIHCRDAHADLRTLITERTSQVVDDVKSIRGVTHSFTGTMDDALFYIEEGFYIGLNGIHTFADQYDETIRKLQADRVLLETDAPYLAPVPYRGKRNEPIHVDIIARAIAEKRGVSAEGVIEFIAQTTRNARSLFCIE